MKQYTVKITDEALADMEGIYNYIAHNLSAPENAIAQYNRIADAILSLNVFPERYSIFDSEPEHSLRIRKMAVDHYLVCYIVDSEAVTVIAIFYGASDVHVRLRERSE